MQFISNNKMLSQSFCLLLLGLLSNHVTAQNISSQELWKGVVIDSENNTAYVLHPKSGIDSISIQTGLTSWHSEEATRPLLINDSQLIAHADSLGAGKISLVSLEKNTGELIQAQLISVANNVNSNVAHGLNQQFDITIDTNNPLRQTIQWQYKDQVIKGMLPENQIKPSFTYGEISLDKNLSLSAAKNRVLTQKPHKQKSAIEGNFIDNIEGRQFKSVDAKHILVSTLKKDTSLWNKYIWTIFDLSGQSLGTLDNSVSYNAFIVSNDTLLFVSPAYARYKKSGTIKAPLSLNAHSLSSNQHLWTKEIRDLRFQGVYPH